MKTIFYLIDLEEKRLIESYEGLDDVPPKKAVTDARDLTRKTGHTYTLARGTMFFQGNGLD